MNVTFSLCDKCGGDPGESLARIRIHFYDSDRSVDKELYLCSHCAQELLAIVEAFKGAVEDLKKRSMKELAVHVYNTVGQQKDSNSNESS